MGVPKGFRTDLSIHPTTFGPAKRQEYLDDIAEKGTLLPKPILEIDMDKAFIEFVNKDLEMTIDGTKVPVYFFTLQKWTEFNQTWEHTDKYKNMVIPFVTIVRHPDIQEGTNQVGLWNIPGRRTYTYLKVPTNDGARIGVDTYKIPQPTSVDITYEIRLFANRLKDINQLSRIVRKTFQSRQHYINVNGHPIPLVTDSTGDESNIENFEERRYYVVMYEMKMMGYILDDADFEVLPTINRTSTSLLLFGTKPSPPISFNPIIENNSVVYAVIFKPRANSEFNFISQYNIAFNEIIDIENASRIVIRKNDLVIFDGLTMVGTLTINKNDNISIKAYRNAFIITKFKLIGFVQL